MQKPNSKNVFGMFENVTVKWTWVGRVIRDKVIAYESEKSQIL